MPAYSELKTVFREEEIIYKVKQLYRYAITDSIANEYRRYINDIVLAKYAGSRSTFGEIKALLDKTNQCMFQELGSEAKAASSQ